MDRIDLNADMGEGYGAWTMGDDAALLDIVTSANIACGFHAGDPVVMDRTIRAAIERGVRVAAHPGFNDRDGFGRRQIRGDSRETVALGILYQIGAFRAVSAAAGACPAYVKLHGALANMAMAEDFFAAAFLDAMAMGSPGLPVMAMPGSRVEALAEEAGVRVIREAYADRAYLPDGTLMPRSWPGSVIHDADAVAETVLRMLDAGAITAHDGTRIPCRIDSICVHGDNPKALAIAEGLRTRLEAAGITVAAT